MAEKSEKRACAACGSVIAQGKKQCPLCGLPVGQDTPVETAAVSVGAAAAFQEQPKASNGPTTVLSQEELTSWGQSGSTKVLAGGSCSFEGAVGNDEQVPPDKKAWKKRLVIGFVVLVVVLLVRLVVYGAISSCSGAIPSTGSVVESDMNPAAAAGNHGLEQGNAPGILADGGVSVRAGEDCFLAANNGIIYQRYDQLGTDDFTQVYNGSNTAYLNYANGKLYFVDGAEDVDGVIKGTTIKAVSVNSETMEFEGKPEDILEVDSGASILPTPRIYDLFYYSGTLYFMYDQDDDAILGMVRNEDVDDSSTIIGAKAGSRLLNVDSSYAWIAMEGTTPETKGEWGIQKVDYTQQPPKGTGFSLKTPTVSAIAYGEGDEIYCSSGEGSFLKQVSTQGNYREFTDVKNVVHIACANDTVAVLSSEGSMKCVSTLTGLTHDYDDALAKAMAIFGSEQSHLGICGDWVFIVDYWSGTYQINTRTSEVKML